MTSCLADLAAQEGSLLTPTESIQVSALLAVRNRFQGYRRKRLALAGSPASFIRWLVVLDGIADSIYLLPRELSPLDVSQLLAEQPFDRLMGDHPNSVADTSLFDRDHAHCAAKPELEGSLESTLATKLLLPTSGTTGVPKFVAHTLEELSRPIRRTSGRGKLHWGLLYDPARFAGMQVLLQSVLNGETVLAPAAEWELTKKVEWLAGHSCDALSATPSLWRQILACPASQLLPLVQITLGGEICDQPLLNALKRRYPLARLTQIYASTEAGVVFSVHDEKPGFPAEWLRVGTRNRKLRISADGTLEVTQASATAEEIWIDTGDVVERDGERVFFRGRKSGLINVGGNKVYPEEIETALNSLEGVESVLVSARNSSLMGSLLEAQIVPTASAPDDLADRVRLYCRQFLPRYKQPAFIKVVHELPVNTTGKRKRDWKTNE
jgi:acyl-CoA synthetase (AMP-forming)/AMP-acid ligase II